MALRSSATRVLQALHQRGLLLQPARAFSVATSDALDEMYSSARPPTVCILGPPVRAAAEGFGSAARLCFPRLSLLPRSAGGCHRRWVARGPQRRRVPPPPPLPLLPASADAAPTAPDLAPPLPACLVLQGVGEMRATWLVSFENATAPLRWQSAGSVAGQPHAGAAWPGGTLLLAPSS